MLVWVGLGGRLMQELQPCPKDRGPTKLGRLGIPGLVIPDL